VPLAVGAGEVGDGVGVPLGVGEGVGVVVPEGVGVGLGDEGVGPGDRLGEGGLDVGAGVRDRGVLTGGVVALSGPVAVKPWWWAALADGWTLTACLGGW
jgi:hypothetical protein